VRYTSRTNPVASVVGINPNTFQIGHVLSITYYLSFEDQSSVFYPHPASTLLDSARATLPESFGIDLKRIDTAFFKRGLSVDRDYQIEIIDSRQPQTGHFFIYFDRPSLFE